MKKEVKDIIESVICNENKDRIINPKKNTTCFLKINDSFIPVKIISGCFYGEHGVSNFWEWINLNTNEKECGYGNFYTM
jgi:hypothetical protein